GMALPSAEASQVRVLSLEELFDRSAAVVCARVMICQCRWAAIAGVRRIITCSRLVVDEVLLDTSGVFLPMGNSQKGEKSEDKALKEAMVWTLGGRVEGWEQKVPGAASVQPGEFGVFFLRRESTLGHGLVGMAQGYRSVEMGPEPRLAEQTEGDPRLSGMPLKHLREHAQRVARKGEK
ncbi:MAG: hypothetical protein MK135_05570, partial [Polyangiaceae bacterium]|nr:hypothetical protein [Polyangiaceae bacterium]